jgi:hypothetical protein
VTLDKVPSDTQLVIGRTATVEVLPRKSDDQNKVNKKAPEQGAS